MKLWTHWYLAASTCATVFFFTAIAAVAQPIGSSQVLTDQKGAVVIRLISTGSTSDDPTEGLESITLQRNLAPGESSGSTTFEVLDRVGSNQIDRSTAIFSGMVSPGRYILFQARGEQRTDKGKATYKFPLSGMLGSIEVKPHQVSVMGTLLIHTLAGGATL